MERFFRYIGYVFEAIIMVCLFFVVLPVRMIDAFICRLSVK